MTRPAPRTVRPCLKRLGKLSAYLDRELPAAACKEIQKHMAGCADCRVVLKTLKKTIALCRQAPAKPPSRAALARVLSAVKRDLAKSRPKP
ncbi:MAG TPA: zf-HC2 domain-containing protein [Nitrospiria bacterium]|nr:zf-HC2 domain-containing protein [Nitrospiria bacterium]